MEVKSDFITDESGMVYNSKFLLFQQINNDLNWYLIFNNSIIARNNDLEELKEWTKNNINII